MIKKTSALGVVAVFILGITLLAESVHALTTTAPNGIMMPEDITFIPDPEHTQIACDLNGVVITWNHSWSAIRDHAICRNNAFIPLYIFNVPLVLRIIALLSRRANPAEYTQLFEQNHKDAAAQLIRNIAAEQNHIPGTIHIMQDLKQRGYTINIISNVGKTHLNDLRNKPEHEIIFNLFDNLFFVDYALVPVIKKPDVRFFELYNQKLNKAHQSVVVIDDNLKNVQAAAQAGMVGIHFRHAQQLRLALQSLGILI